MSLLNFAKDVQGFNTFAAAFSDIKYSAKIASSGNATITIPSTGENWVISFSFQPGSNIWIAVNTTAAIPAGATFAITQSELLPGARSVKSGDTINILNNGTTDADIGVVLYAIP
jgi:hypothetical protein